jgi:hypothetical protein
LLQILTHALPKRIDVAATGGFTESFPGKRWARQRLFWNDDNVIDLTLVSKQVAELVGPLIYERVRVTLIDLIYHGPHNYETTRVEELQRKREKGEEIWFEGQVWEYLKGVKSLEAVGRRE